MYLEIRFSARKSGEKIPIAVLRKSIRRNGKVSHEDLGYLSGLPLDTLYAIRDVIKSSNLTTKNNKKNLTSEHDDIASNSK
jgi:hypothetical protein